MSAHRGWRGMVQETEPTESVKLMESVTADDLRWDPAGLVVAVVQHVETKDMLMVGYMNAEALARTLAGPHVVFWSRSRNELWEKGATSGNYLNVATVTADCDGDVVLVRALPDGPTCHTGAYSCFHRPVATPALPAFAVEPEADSVNAHVLDDVAAVIAQRKREMPEGSYTTYLFREGVDKIAKKVGEEAAETIIGAKNVQRGDADAPALLAGEVADLFYHSLVLLQATGVPLESVWDALAYRRGGAAPDAPPRGPKPGK